MANSLGFRYAAHSDTGTVRAKNDDSGYAGKFLAIVADGMGGHAGGDVASASTVLELIHLDRTNYAKGEAITALADEIQTANLLLSEMVRSDPKLTGMGTTVTSLLLSDENIAFAHIGDSRAYRLNKDGDFRQVSTDHTFVQRLIDEGRLESSEAETHPQKNVLLRVLGDVDVSPELDLHSYKAVPGERWLLCSDGLNTLSFAEIKELVNSERPLEEIVKTLVQRALDAGSTDNVTAVLVEVEELSATDTQQLKQLSTTTTSEEPALGARLESEAVAAELASHDHAIVGAAATATQEGKIPKIAREDEASERSTEVLRQKAPDKNLDDEEDDEEELILEPARKRPWVAIVITLSIVLIVAIGCWFAYSWTQGRYYVGEADGKVAIFRGVSQNLGPIKLSSEYENTQIPVNSLPEFSQQRLRYTLPAANIDEARRIVEDLRLGRINSTETPSPYSPSNSPPPTPLPPPATPVDPPQGGGS